MGQSNSNPQQSINEESMKKDEPEIIMKQVDRFIYDEKKDQIGKGVFALVYKGFDPENDNKEVAIKRISKRSIENYRDHQEIFLREINILSKLDHPYCIKLVKAFRTETGNIYIVTNFCNQGSLEQLLKRRKTLSEPEALTVVRQIAEAMCALERLEPENGEKKSVVLLHRDIKPANILLHDGECRLADFGFSKLVEKNNEGNSLKHTQLGTPTYMPPQLLDDKEYSEKCDIWATGVLLYQMLFGDIPWRGSTMYEIYDNIFDQPLKFPGTVQEKVKKLISAMLDTNEKERVSWKGILDHPAIRNKGPDVKIQQDEKHATISYISISTGTDSDTESVRW